MSCIRRRRLVTQRLGKNEETDVECCDEKFKPAAKCQDCPEARSQMGCESLPILAVYVGEDDRD